MRWLTERTRAAVRAVVRPGDGALDATAGNGGDTLLLARLVGPTGRVYAFDIQPAALARTAAVLAADGRENVTLVRRDHADLLAVVPPDTRFGAAMFNLGYLPGGGNLTMTSAATTVVALAAAVGLLRPGGVLTVVAYRGHPGGADETDAVAAWATGLGSDYRVENVRGDSANAGAPTLWMVRPVERIDHGSIRTYLTTTGSDDTFSPNTCSKMIG